MLFYFYRWNFGLKSDGIEVGRDVLEIVVEAVVGKIIDLSYMYLAMCK